MRNGPPAVVSASDTDVVLWLQCWACEHIVTATSEEETFAAMRDHEQAVHGIGPGEAQ